jgi:hypothetical protein
VSERRGETQRENCATERETERERERETTKRGNRGEAASKWVRERFRLRGKGGGDIEKTGLKYSGRVIAYEIYSESDSQ